MRRRPCGRHVPFYTLERIDGTLERIDGTLERIDGTLERIDGRFDHVRAVFGGQAIRIKISPRMWNLKNLWLYIIYLQLWSWPHDSDSGHPSAAGPNVIPIRQ